MIKMTRREILQSMLAGTMFGSSLGETHAGAGRSIEGHRLDWASEVIPLATHHATGPAPVVTGLSLQPMGSRLALAGDDHRVRICARDTGELCNLLQGHEQWVRCLQFTPGGHFLLTAGYDRRLLQWDADSGELQKEVVRTSFPITAMCLHPETHFAAVAGFSGKVTWLDWVENRRVGETTVACEDLRALALSPDGKLLVTGGRDGVLYGLDTSSRELILEKSIHKRRIRDLIFSPDGTWVLSCGEDAMIYATHLKRDDLSFKLRSEHAKVLAIEWLNDDLFATAGTDNKIAIWDLRRRALVGHLIGHDGTITSLAFDGIRLYSAGYDTTLRIWSANPNFAAGPSGGVRVGRDRGPNTTVNQ